ncbi:MAG TPA: DUF6531 domain-containing protein, partial [Actinotalea sp.]
RPTLAARLRTTALAAVLAATGFAVTATPATAPATTGSSPFEGIVQVADKLFAPKTALAAFCASNAVFTGRLTASSSSTTAVSRITDPDVYAYISNVDADWSCTAYLRYSGVAWNTTASAGRFDWGNLINSTSVGCNYLVGSTDFIKANSTADCPDTDAEYALMATLTGERVYHADLNHNTIGDFSFIHADCGTYYSGTVAGEPIQGSESAPETFAGSNVDNRPGANCDALTIDGTGTTQTITYDKTAPAVNFDTPDEAAALATVTTAAYTVGFDATDAVAAFGGANGWTLSRQIAAWDGAACGAWTADTATGAVTTGVTSALDQTSVQSLLSGSCYRWTLGATDQNGNTATTITSGPVRRDATALLGVEGYGRFESFDLGAGDGLAVNVATGNVTLSHPLVSLPIRGSSVGIDLAYNSQDTANVGMGPGWRLNMHRRLALNADGSVTVTDGDGSRHTFTSPQTAGTVTTYTRPATLYATLVKDTSVSANEFVLTYRDQSRDKFDIAGSEGLLVREEDRFGNGVDLAYVAGTNRISTITDTAASRTITFGYDASNRLASITDWAVVSGGVVQASGTGNRVNRFAYDASGRLAGWADPLNTSGACPTAGSHLTCLTYASGTAALVSAISKTQTVEGAGATALTTTTRTITTEIAYRGGEAATVTDAEQQSKGTPARTVFSRPAADQVLVVRPGSPASETKYGLVSASDALARVQSVWRKLGSTSPVWIEERTAYDATYPIEPASVTANYGALGSTPARVTAYTYVANSMGLVSRTTEPLTASSNRTTDSTYNANNDVTQTITGQSPADPLHPAVTARSCYDASCTTTGTGLVLLKTISNYIDGVPGNGTDIDSPSVQDITTTFQSDAYGQRIRETRANYSPSGTLL